MPEDLVATRALLGEVLDHLETIEKRMAWRSRITAAGFLLVAVCILVIAGVVRNNRDEQIASCKAGREELRVMAEAIASGSADGLRTIGLSNPRNQTPEAKAIVHAFADRYEENYRADLLEVTPRPEDCGTVG